jgi:hypothetical protein
MITISGSEPLLAEAAYELMKGTGTNAVCHLAEHSGLNYINRERRGEMVAVLLIMQAYDAARVFSGRRWVSVVNFMEALLPPLKYNTLLQSDHWPTQDTALPVNAMMSMPRSSSHSPEAKKPGRRVRRSTRRRQLITIRCHNQPSEFRMNCSMRMNVLL